MTERSGQRQKLQEKQRDRSRGYDRRLFYFLGKIFSE